MEAAGGDEGDLNGDDDDARGDGRLNDPEP